MNHQIKDKVDKILVTHDGVLVGDDNNTNGDESTIKVEIFTLLKVLKYKIYWIL